MLYPIKFKKIYKEKIWGGEKIKNLKKDNKIITNCGECWEISALEGSMSIINNGFLKNSTIEEAIEIYMGDFVGDRIFDKFGTEFPLLVKIIDAKENLSLQVHPDNEIAYQRHDAWGKSEMWFVLNAEKNASIISGFNKNTDAEEFHESIHRGNPEKLLNKIKVKRGDAFYIPANQPHSLGNGTVVLEIQQCSDITYRLYDYGRTDRELHHDLAFDIINYEITNFPKTEYKKEINCSNKIIESEFFSVNYLPFINKIDLDYENIDSFVLLFSTHGEFSVDYENVSTKVDTNEIVLIPAELKEITLKTEGLCEIIEVYINIDNE
ncbi:MAG: class I mannose-6-phosphate isomerase [Bacteroidales bacterium]|jgi:mannose-6-phosphate isomerase|nr:class I mannose-6-phosphate isomerase [Bacteroidales bacterium]